MIVTLSTSLSLFRLRVGENHLQNCKKPTCQTKNPVKNSGMLLQHLFSPRLLANKPSKTSRAKQMESVQQQTMEHCPRHLRLDDLLSPDLLHGTVNEGLADW
jgi:hypothetical protein